MKEQISITPESLSFGIKKDFNLDISDLIEVQGGWSSKVFKGKLESEYVFIRLNTDSKIYPAEILAYKELQKKGIPTPRIISHQENPETIKYPIIIMTQAPGILLGKGINASIFEYEQYKQVGKILRTMHEIVLPGYGKLFSKNNILEGEFSNWQQYIDSQCEHDSSNLEYLFDHSLINDYQKGRLQEVREELKDVYTNPGVFVHRDMHSAHIFTEGENISCVIDLGSCMSGDPRYDIATSLSFQTDEQEKAFIEGYGPLALDPVVQKYLLIIAANKMAFRHKRNLPDALEQITRVFLKTIQRFQKTID